MLLLCALLACSQADDVSMSGGGATAQVLGHSGKIILSLDDKSIRITMNTITERDADGDAVGKSGANEDKHTVNIASKDFTFSDIYDTSYQNLNASVVNFTCSLVGDSAYLHVDLIVFLEDGNITVNTTEYQVTRGSFKFSYYVDNWPFCSAGGEGHHECKKGNIDEVGEYLDFEVLLENENSDVEGATSSNISWTDNSMVLMPRAYMVNDTWMDMDTGYPSVEPQGSKAVLTLRFNRFVGEVYYDPLVSWGFGEGSGSTNGDSKRYPDIAGGWTTVIVLVVVGGALLIGVTVFLILTYCPPTQKGKNQNVECTPV